MPVTIKLKSKRFRPYDEAKEYIQSLEIDSVAKYKAWASSDERPNDIPSSPDRSYFGYGWVSWFDFFGKDGTPRKPS